MSRYIITAPEPFTGSGYGLIFVNGKAVTESGRIAQHLAQKGYAVEEWTKPAPAEIADEPEAVPPESEEMPGDASAEPQEESPPPRRRGRAAAKEAPPPEGTERDG